MIEAGFIFWGLFVVFALFVAAYVIWMRRAERAENGRRSEGKE